MDDRVGSRSDFIRQLVETHGGRVRFDFWMREALANPQYGYYPTGIRALGRRGDFSTWPTMDATLARAVGAWLRRNRERHRAWRSLEIGAGDGSLAAGIRSGFGWWPKPRMHLVEISPKLIALQQSRIGRNHATWHSQMPDALRACDGHALIIANELADAFPCRVFRREHGQWMELHVEIRGGRAEECWQTPPQPFPPSNVFLEDWPEGQRVEVHESFFDWLREWRSSWRGGRMVLIDYGDRCPELYRRRPGGTLRAYAHHQRFHGRDVLDGFGRRDLTSDVNFSDIRAHASALNLSSSPLQSLGEWMAGQGVAVADRFQEAAQIFKVQELSPRCGHADTGK